jgi:hypothetical protein
MFRDEYDYDPNHDWQSILRIWEEFSEPSHTNPHLNLKHKAAAFMDTASHPLTRTELRQLLSKAHKLKKSTKKGERARGIELEKQIQRVFNKER